MSFILVILAFCAMLHPASSLTSFEPNCTLPDKPVNVVGLPNIRSTFSVLWDCILILSICIWSVQHLNVPPPVEENDVSRTWTKAFTSSLELVKWMVITLFLPEIIIGFAFQDWQMSRWFSREVIQQGAHRGSQARRRQGNEFLHWTTTHTFFANMGGFAIRFNKLQELEHLPLEHRVSKDTLLDLKRLNDDLWVVFEEPTISISEQGIQQNRQSDDRDDHPSTELPTPGDAHQQDPPKDHEDASMTNSSEGHGSIVHENSGQSTGEVPVHETEQVDIALESTTDCTTSAEHGDTTSNDPIHSAELSEDEPSSGVDVPKAVIYYLNAVQLYAAYQMDLIPNLELASKEEILDKAKSDLFVKGTAMIKLIHLLLSTSSRLLEGLKVSQLELITVAFSLCMITAYIFYWDKPQSVAIPITKTYQSIPVQKAQILRWFSDVSFINLDLLPQGWNEELIPGREDEVAKRVKRRYLDQSIPNDALVGNLRPLRGISIHHAEFAVVIASLLFGGVHCIAVWGFQFPSEWLWWTWLVASVATTVIPLIFASFNMFIKAKQLTQNGCAIGFKFVLATTYVAARAFLVVEAFHSLFYQPLEVFMSH